MSNGTQDNKNQSSSAKAHAESFKKSVWYDQEVVGTLLESLRSKMPKGTHILNGDGHLHNIGGSDGFNAPKVTTNNDELVENLAQVPEDAKHVVGIFLVGQGAKGGGLDKQEYEGNHYIAAVFDKDKNTLTMLDPLGSIDTISEGYKDFADKIVENFKAKFAPDKEISIKRNPREYFLKQQDASSCGPACVHMVDHFVREEKIKKDKNLGITKGQDSGFELEEGAEKLRKAQAKQYEEYEEEKKRKPQTIGADFIGSSDKITKLWDEREEDLKKILKNHKFADISMLDQEGKAHKMTADELIKHYQNARSTDQKEWGKAKAEITQYQQAFSNKLAAEVEKSGQKLDFSQNIMKFNTGGRDLELSVKVSDSKLKQLTINEHTLKPEDNFTMSLSFQDKNGNNMFKKEALHFQIRVDGGIITAVNHPPLLKDEKGQYYASGPGDERFYPKFDNATIDRIMVIKAEKQMEADHVAVHNPNKGKGALDVSSLRGESGGGAQKTDSVRPPSSPRSPSSKSALEL